ncbi:hypothetical protein CEXT_31911 [Caerostris extrusa]|uniref:7TM GPCR serpentine receptor class x (Srx) domain-containing protein n=1 Tax=Caerostris extrusa TaxID=172846 RepID=A0AAV4SB83_CAEEX|nr:hypothetical protein CEXT_31911 [Caerostris extrusa]
MDLTVGVINVLTDIIWKITVAFYADNIACKLIKYLQGVHLQYLSYIFISPEVSRKDFVPDIEQADIRPLYTSRATRFLLQDPSGEIFWVTRDIYGCFMGQTAFLCLLNALAFNAVGILHFPLVNIRFTTCRYVVVAIWASICNILSYIFVSPKVSGKDSVLNIEQVDIRPFIYPEQHVLYYKILPARFSGLHEIFIDVLWGRLRFFAFECMLLHLTLLVF